MNQKDLKVQFICQNELNLSFWVKVSFQNRGAVTVAGLINQAKMMFRMRSKKQFNTDKFYSQQSTDIKKLEGRLYLNTICKYRPFYFDAVRLSFNVTVTDFKKDQKKTLNWSISPLASGKTFVEQICSQFNIQGNQKLIRISFNGKILRHDQSSLLQQQVQDNEKFEISILNTEPHLFDSKYEDKQSFNNSSIKNKLFVDIENDESKKELNFSKDAPDYRVCCPGLNIEGYCRQNNCKYYNKFQIVPVGFGTMEMIRDLYGDVQCINTECKKPIDIITCGFYKCNYSWIGHKKSNTETWISSQGQLEASSEKYTRYQETKNDGQESNMVEWQELHITAVEKTANIICLLCPDIINQNEGVSIPGCRDPRNHQIHQICKELYESAQTDNKLECPYCPETHT